MLTVPLYFLVLLMCAVWAHRRNRQEVNRSSSGITFQLHQAGRTDTLSVHYLGGRSLNPVLTAGTIFASFFSGYTFVGIPDEAYKVRYGLGSLQQMSIDYHFLEFFSINAWLPTPDLFFFRLPFLSSIHLSPSKEWMVSTKMDSWFHGSPSRILWNRFATTKDGFGKKSQDPSGLHYRSLPMPNFALHSFGATSCTLNLVYLWPSSGSSVYL
jgi:hypothetical protein